MNIKNLKPNYDSPYYQSYYTPINKEKYIGSYPVICRSSLELRMCVYLDKNENITKWSSEPFSIKYVLITNNTVHNYYPDYYFEFKGEQCVAEVKPKKQIKKPKEPSKKTTSSIKNYNILLETYYKNYSKISSLKEFCDINKYKLFIITEDELDMLSKTIN